MIKFLSLVAVAAFLLGWADGARADELVQVEIRKGETIRLPRAASSVVIADPATADVQVVSPHLVYVYGKKIGETSLTIVDAKDDPVFEGTIEVTHNLSSLQRAAKRVAPNSDVEFKTVDGGLVLEGAAGSVQESESLRNLAEAYVGTGDKLVNMMSTTGGDQVTLQVKIVEMSRTDLKTLGLNIQSVLDRGGLDLQILQGNAITMAGGIVTRNGGANGLFGSLTSGASSISGLIDALETQGLATVLAEPTLTSSSGKPASFLAGGQYPIPLRGENGTVTIQYQPFGVSLNFTPIIMSKDRMSILVAPEVSSLNFNNPVAVAGFNYPILDTRRAQATVELGSGQTFALAGLLRNETSNNLSKMPGIGDVPLLGSLFRSNRFQSNQTELVILVTPYIVRPVSDPKKLQTPIDGLRHPSDTERLLLGSLYQQQPLEKPEKKGEKSAADKEDDGMAEPTPQLNGDAGFVLE
jgi:pilus assembly protein CpaC